MFGGPELASAHVPPESVDLKTPPSYRPSVERGGGRGIDGQGGDVRVLSPVITVQVPPESVDLKTAAKARVPA